MVGACIGFVGVISVRVLVLGDSFDGLHSKFAETGMLETVGISLLAILILLFSIFLQVLLHEGGHLVCGLATGYRFVSFRIFNLTFIRKDGKLCIKRFSLAGTGGQCLLTPPERPLEDIPTTLYNLGGVLANLLTAILAFLPLLTVDGLPYLLKFFLLMLSLIGILLAGMNGIPMKMGGIGNDADNMCLLLKDSKSKQALVTQLRINALVQEGMRPKDMPAEWFSQTEDINYKGTPLPMGTPVDHLGREAHITEEAVLVAQGKLTEQERENRLLLRQVMKEAGFHPLPSEWWHFNRVGRQTAKERYRVIP